MNKHRKVQIKLDELNVWRGKLLFEQLILRANTTFNATWFFFFLFSLYFSIPPLSRRSFTLYSFFLNYLDRTLVHHLSPHLSICPISHLFWLSVNGDGWNCTVQRSSPHKCGQRSCCSAFNVVVAAFASRYSVFLSSLHVPKVHPYFWIFLEGHLDCLNICLIDIFCIRGV